MRRNLPMAEATRSPGVEYETRDRTATTPDERGREEC